MRFSLAVLTAVLTFSVLPIGISPFPPSASAQDGVQTHLEVNKITPSLVTGQGEVTVIGILTNDSDYEINNVEARIERGAAVQSDSGARAAMEGQSPRVTQPNFRTLTDTLSPGEQLPFEIRAPLSGAPDSLSITEPGSYPLVVNVNGTPSYGGRARIAEADFLLPVVSTEESPPSPPQQPLPTRMLIPIVGYPRVEGTEGSKPILSDNQLGDSLSSGGRLSELVEASRDGIHPNSPLATSVCFAIDPDLLSAVDAMQHGYRVRQPGGGTSEGSSAKAAGDWLGKLKEITAGRCVISLPFADADVVALGKADLPDLIKGSLDGSRFIKAILGVEPRKDVFWPIDGAMDEPAASTLSDRGIKTMLMRPNSLDGEDNPLRPTRLSTKGSPVAMPIDPLLTRALNPPEDAPRSAMSPSTNGALSSQNTLGALAYRATTRAAQDRISVLAPPRRWNLRGDDLRALLSGMHAMYDAGYLMPAGRPSEAGGEQVDLSYPRSAAREEIRGPVLDKLAQENFKVGDLYRSARKDPVADIAPAAVTTPLRDGLLRGASSAWRGNPVASRDWVSKGADLVASVLSAVQIHIPPAGAVTLSAKDSPIPVKVSNDLPITVRVLLHTPRSSGIKIKPLGVLSVPQGSRSFFPPGQVERAGRFTVDITATTEGGTKLGTPKRLQVESSNYGGLIPGLTAAAGALLVVLSAIRIFRRVRGRLRPAAGPSSGPSSGSSSGPSSGSSTTVDGVDGPS